MEVMSPFVPKESNGPIIDNFIDRVNMITMKQKTTQDIQQDYFQRIEGRID